MFTVNSSGRLLSGPDCEFVLISSKLLLRMLDALSMLLLLKSGSDLWLWPFDEYDGVFVDWLPPSGNVTATVVTISVLGSLGSNGSEYPRHTSSDTLSPMGIPWNMLTTSWWVYPNTHVSLTKTNTSPTIGSALINTWQAGQQVFINIYLDEQSNVFTQLINEGSSVIKAILENICTDMHRTLHFLIRDVPHGWNTFLMISPVFSRPSAKAGPWGTTFLICRNSSSVSSPPTIVNPKPRGLFASTVL